MGLVSPEIRKLVCKVYVLVIVYCENYCEISLTPLNTIYSHAKVTGGPALTLGSMLQL